MRLTSLLYADEQDRQFLLIETAKKVIERWNAFIGTEDGQEVVRLQLQRLARVSP